MPREIPQYVALKVEGSKTLLYVNVACITQFVFSDENKTVDVTYLSDGATPHTLHIKSNEAQGLRAKLIGEHFGGPGT